MKNISFLEFGNIDPTKNIFPIHVLNWIVKYATLLDQSSFKRLWLTEHYHPHFAWFSPETLLPVLAMATQKLRLGQAGVILNIHNPIFVA